jgi:hypothetical protein
LFLIEWFLKFKGEEKNISDDSVCHPKIHEQLLKFLKINFGISKDQIEYQWTGIMGFTVDQYPLVGEFQKNAYIGMIVMHIKI